MILGRFVYGIGGESCSVVLNKLISKEFANSNIAFALGLFSSISRLGSILNFSSSPLIAERIHEVVPCGIGFIFTLISFFCFVENENYENNILNSKPLLNNVNEQKINHSNIFYEVDFKQSPYTPWESIERDITNEIFDDIKKTAPKQLFKEADTIFYEPSIENANSFHSCFIFIILISFTIALIWAPFYSLAPIIFKIKYKMSTIETGKLLAYIEFLGLFLNPFMGTLEDRYAHSSLYLNYFSPFIISTALGFAGPFVNSYWPCIPKLVSDNNLSNGFAIIYCVLNFAYTISPIALGLLAAKDQNLNYVVLFLIILSVVTIILAWILICLNRKFKLGLNNSKHQSMLIS
ncbi:major facilitator superfamily protein [Vairimorpha apis BRL 01]|uniref:Lysosomal dipeptide transporter MFSD1 n=1 Tax=Vairimorpha apis BRL 01 TaxID=1037528 RepID=T0L7P2_9MICR|nr:major facilitator superfamily protein [Vairimorpha apis BRL 01]